MMLSDKTIKEYLSLGKIIILPKFNIADIRPVGIRLHLGPEILIPVPGQTVDLEMSEELKFDRVSILTEKYILKPGEFILGSTYESFQVPRNIICHIEGRSTVARLGLAIHCTSGIIDGNFEEPRTVVLEMKNNGPFNIVLKYQMALAMVTFTEISSEIKQSQQEQYRGQNGTVAPNLKVQKR